MIQHLCLYKQLLSIQASISYTCSFCIYEL